MLGAYAVGKTSLVSRFVKGMFSERYKTTVGVKIDRKDLVVDGNLVRLLVWDLPGEDAYQRVKGAYLRGASGCLLVVDSTRGNTLHASKRLLAWARGIIGPIPFTLLLNKTDLEGDPTIDASSLSAALDANCHVLETSALTGEGVEHAFADLASRMVDGTP